MNLRHEHSSGNWSGHRTELGLELRPEHGLERGLERDELGFTLVELMIAAAILGVILAGVFYSFGIQNEKYVVVDQVTEAQQNLRGVAEMLERDIRRAGYLVPAQAAACAHDSTSGPDMLALSDADAIRTIDELATDAPELLSGELGVDVVSFSTTTVRVAGGVLAPQLEIDPGTGSGFVVGGGLILTDRNDSEGRVACAKITDIEDDTLTVDFGSGTYAMAIGSNDVVAIPAILYEVEAPTSTEPSRLMRNGLLLAYDVEDLQAVFFFDDDGDATRDDATELFGAENAASTYPPATGTGFDMRSLRELEIHVVTITRGEAPNSAFLDATGNSTLSQGQRAANHTSGLAASDRRLRRIHTASVRLRNLG